MKPKSTFRSFLALAGSSLLAISSASAQSTLYWDGATPAGAPGGGAGTWNTTTTNWDTSLAGGDVAWDNTSPFDTAVFAGTAGTVTLGTSISVDTINLNTAGYAISPSATNQLTVSTINVAGGGTSSFGAAGIVNIGGSLLTVTTATAADRFSFAQEGATNSTRITLNESTSAGTAISGPGYINFRLVANNTTGGISISGGATVLLSNTIADSLGTNNLTINGGQVSTYTSTAIIRALGTGASQIQITGGVSGFDTTGTVTFNNNATTEVVWGSAVFNPTTFVLSASALANNTDLSGANRTVQVRSGTTGTMSGVIRNSDLVNAAGLIKTGDGTLFLSNTGNTYNGGTTVNTGTLVFRNTGAKSASGTHAFDAGTTLGLGVGGSGFFSEADVTSAFGSGTILTNVTVTATTNVAVDTTAGSFIHSANITGSPTKSLTKFGSNTLSLNGANSYTGTTTISAGTLSTNNVADAGSNSGIGAFASAGASGLLLQGGSFTYSGATASTNRGFTYGAASSSTTGTITVSTNAAVLTMGDATINSTGSMALAGGTGSSLALGTVTQNAVWTFTGAPALSVQAITLGAGVSSISTNNGSFTVGNITGTNQGYQIGGAGGTVTGTIALGTGNLTKAGTGTWTLTGSSSYSGTTTLNGNSTVNINSIKNVGGGNSSLGAPTTTANGTIALNSGTLRYIGTSGTVSTNRVINLGGSVSLDMSGTGTLTFTSALTSSNGSKTLTLTGSTAGIGELAGAIVNGGTGSNAVTKTGSGTWILSGDSSGATGYTGATTISNGTLSLSGAKLKSAITVASGATLGLTTASLATTTGTVTLDAGHKISITGSVDNVSNYKLLTASSIDGTPNVDPVVPNYTPQLQSGNTELWLVYTGGGGSAYDTWKAANAPGSNPGDDTDGDGVSNAVEFVLGGTSATNDLAKLPQVAANGTNMTFTFKRKQSSIDPKTSVAIELGTDLVTWTTPPSPYTVPDGETAGPPVTVEKGVPADYDTVTLTVAQDSARKFARLKVVITP